MENTKIKNLIPAELNEGQKKAYIKMRNYVDGDLPMGTMLLIEGYAGVGKTYLVGKLLNYIFEKHSNWKVAVTAPTNKAVKVLHKSSSINNSKVEFQTIHKLLGLKEEITAEGKQIFTKQNDYNNDIDIEDFNLVIVDEVSMLNDDLFFELSTYKESIFMIFMGDPAQIPPVGRIDCIPFREDKRKEHMIEMCLLTEIMRQEIDNPIIETSFILRQDLSNPRPDILPETRLNIKGSGIVFINSGIPEGRDEFTNLLEEHFTSEKFKNNPDYAKVIAWTNRTVDGCNNIIRKMIFGADSKKIMLGEKLLANKPIMDPSLKFIVLFNTSDEFEVLSYSIDVRSFPTEAETVRLSYYNTVVLYTDILGKSYRKSIQILHEDSEEDFNRVVGFMKKDAIRIPKGPESKKAWQKYYAFLRKFADVKYNYSVTVHKAQGSTYINTFIMEDDIYKNRDVVERNRILYTAYTRPSEKLFVLKR